MDAREQRQRQVGLGTGLLREPNDLGFLEGLNGLLFDLPKLYLAKA